LYEWPILADRVSDREAIRGTPEQRYFVGVRALKLREF